MKLILENWRRFTERLGWQEKTVPEKTVPLYSPLTQSSFANLLSKRGADGSWPLSVEKDSQMQVGVLLGLFNSLKKAPEEDPEWYGSRMPDLTKGEGFSVSTILNSIYKVGGETKDFLFVNKQAALDFLNLVRKPSAEQSSSLGQSADIPAPALTIKAK
jgi:hypothetical protein